jgi:atypical dual specificity phosphatase
MDELPLYIAGISRSVSVCLAYLVKYENMTLKAAYDHIFHERRFIYPNEGFWRSLMLFEEQITGKNTVEEFSEDSSIISTLRTFVIPGGYWKSFNSMAVFKT